MRQLSYGEGAHLPVHVLIVNYNSAGLLAQCVASLREEPVATISILENGSTRPDEVEALKELQAVDHRVKVCVSETNVGFGSGFNKLLAGLDCPGDDVVWALNPDTMVHPGATRVIEATLRQRERAFVSPVLIFPSGRVWFAGGAVDIRRGLARHVREGGAARGELPYLTGAALAAQKRAWEELGGFPDDLFLYWEDVDLSTRAILRGMSLVVEKGACVTHSVGGSSVPFRTGRASKSEQWYFYISRNRIVVCAANRWQALSIAVGSGLTVTLRLCVKAALDPVHPAKKLRSVLQGTRDGLRTAPRASGGIGEGLIAHLDHSSEPGGAELALVRLLRRGSWPAVVAVPPSGCGDHDSGVFRGLDRPVRIIGPVQPPGGGAGRHVGILGRIGVAARLAHAGLRLAHDPLVQHAQVLYANTTRAAVYGSVAARILRRPIIVHLRDRVESESMGRAAYSLMRKWVIPRASAVIANSAATAETLESCGGHPSTHVIHSPIGFERMHTPSIVSDETENLVIGMVARLDPWKGQDDLIRAFAREFRWTAARLSLVGGGAFDRTEYAAELRALSIELGVEDQLELVGHVDDVRPWIRDMDVCVQYSKRPEPLGQNLLQYIALAKPIIASDEGAASDLFTAGRDALLVPPRSPAALADALRRMRAPALRRQLAHGAAINEVLESDAAVAMSHWNVVRQTLSGGSALSQGQA